MAQTIGDTLSALEATARSIVSKRGLGTDARIVRVEPEPWRRQHLDENERGSWYWLSIQRDSEWCQVARRRDPRDLVGVASRLTPAVIGGLNFKEQ